MYLFFYKTPKVQKEPAGNDQDDWFFFAYFFVRKGRLFFLV